jgi:hypothetical protein
MAKNSKKFTISINHHICPIFHAENNISKLKLKIQFCPFYWADFDPSWACSFSGSLVLEIFRIQTHVKVIFTIETPPFLQNCDFNEFDSALLFGSMVLEKIFVYKHMHVKMVSF